MTIEARRVNQTVVGKLKVCWQVGVRAVGPRLGVPGSALTSQGFVSWRTPYSPSSKSRNGKVC